MTEVRDDYAEGSEEPSQSFAFETLFQRYSGLVYNLAYRFAQNPADADDISQEVWLKVHQKLDSLRSPKAFSSWLWKTASNVCLDYKRRFRATEPINEMIPSLKNLEGELLS